MDREELILSLALTVRILAKYFCRRLPRHVECEDLIAAGWLGAIHAVDRWDPEIGTLRTFADRHIRGAILDYLRGLDPMKRAARQEHKAAKLRGEEPAGLHLVAINAAASRGTKDQAFRAVEIQRELDSLFARAQLKPRAVAVVRRSYLGEETLAEIGRSMGVHESRTMQIRARALKELRAAA